MSYRIAALDLTPAALDGLSERLIASHYENNYGGALRRLNAIARQLAQLDQAAAPNFTLNGLKREEMIATNSVILHELYFAGLGGKGDPSGELATALERDFGSVAHWRAEFGAMGKALGGGSGWVLLAWLPRDGRLANIWAADHTHAPADGRVVLALDMYEHAYHIDFGARAAAYVDAVLRNFNWDWAGRRFSHVALAGPLPQPKHGSDAMPPESLVSLLGTDRAPLVLDVRRRPAFSAAADMISGATWRDPEAVAGWADALRQGQPVIVYCVYGHQVSEGTAAALRAKGIDAKPLAGGIAAWRALGGPTAPRTDPPP